MGMPVHLNNRCTCVSWDLSRFVLKKKEIEILKKRKIILNKQHNTHQSERGRRRWTPLMLMFQVAQPPSRLPGSLSLMFLSRNQFPTDLYTTRTTPHHCCLASASACVWLRTLSQRTLWQAEAAYDRVHHNHSRNYNHRCLAQLAHNKVNGHSPQTSSLEPKHTNALQRQRTVH